MAPMSTRRHLVHNGVATLLQKLVRVAEQLLLVPFFISAWGPTYYGEWLTLTVLPTTLALSDLGFGTAAATEFVLKFAAGNADAAASAIKTGFRVLAFVGMVILVVSGFGVNLLGQLSFAQQSHIPIEQATAALIILMTSRVVGFFLQLFESFYRAARKAALSTHLLNTLLFLKIGITIAVLGLGGHAVAVAIADLCGTLAFSLVYILVAHRLLPEVRWWRARALDGRASRQLAATGLGHLGYPAWQAIFFQGTTLAVRIALGAHAVAIFNTMRTLSRTVNQVSGMVDAAFFPELQLAIAEARTQTARRLYRVGLGLSVLTAAAGVVVLSLWGNVLYARWTGGELAVTSDIWTPFFAAILVNSLWINPSMVFRAANLPGTFALVGVSSALVAVALCYALAGPFGLAGAVWGTLALEIPLALWSIPSSARIVKQDLRRLPREMLHDLTPRILRSRKDLDREAREEAEAST